MARFAFLTFYDKICLGPRILSSVAKAEGHQSHLVILKEDSGGQIVKDDQIKPINYQYFHHGYLRGTNYDVNPWTEKEIEHLFSILSDLKPDVLCLSTRSFWTDLGRPIVEKIRETLPGIPIVAGGWGPSLEPEKYLEYCDWVCFGEGEEAIRQIGTAINQGRDFSDVPNLMYMQNGQIKRNQAMPPIRDLDSVPFPDFDPLTQYLIENNRLQHGEDFYNEKIYDVFVGRGCPLTCSYCLSGRWNKLYKEKYEHHSPRTRLRSPETSIEEIKRAKKRGALFIRIKDEVFPAKREWVSRFVELYKKEIGLPFFAYLRPEFHKPEMVDMLIDAGLRTTGLGIQSGSNFIRKKIFHRRCPNEKVLDFAKLLSEREVEFHYDIISYNPFEDAQDLKDTFSFLASLPFADLKVFKLAFFPTAPIEALEKALKPIPESNELYRYYAILNCMVMQNRWMRNLAIHIEDLGLFKKRTGVLQALFWPTILREKIKRKRTQKKFKAASMILPGMQKGKKAATTFSKSSHGPKAPHPSVMPGKTPDEIHYVQERHEDNHLHQACE